MNRWRHLAGSTLNGIANLIILSWMTDWLCESQSVFAGVGVLSWAAITLIETYRDFIKERPCLDSSC